ncbi:MAG: hypothetical protein ACOYVK_20640 [Bacillota bacterium]
MKVWKWFAPILVLTLLVMPLAAVYADTDTNNAAVAQQKGNTPGPYSLEFDMAKYTVKTLTVDGKTIKYRAFENIVYVKYPVDTKYQSLNFYVPEEYYEGKSIGSYTAETAPIFLPNAVGGYMPAEPGSPGLKGAGGAPGATEQPGAGGNTNAASPGQPGTAGNTNTGILGQNGGNSSPNAALVALSSKAH